MPGGAKPAKMFVNGRDEPHTPRKIHRKAKSRKRDQDIVGHGLMGLELA